MNRAQKPGNSTTSPSITANVENERLCWSVKVYWGYFVAAAIFHEKHVKWIPMKAVCSKIENILCHFSNKRNYLNNRCIFLELSGVRGQ